MFQQDHNLVCYMTAITEVPNHKLAHFMTDCYLAS